MAIDTLLAAVIHDAKNQLAALGTWIEVARQEHPSVALDQAQSVAAQLGHKLVALLAIYRDGEGQLRLAVEDHDLTDFCADVLAELVLPPDSAIRVDRDETEAERIGSWAFDAYLVRLVVLDALRNAARHALDAIRFSISRDADGICFTISDDGEGFPEDVLRGGEGAMHAAGSGLGLRFARLIARRHATPAGRHGRIELENAGGAVFRLVLP